MDTNKSKNITPDKIKKLVDEIKKINKKIDLRNPLISEGQGSIVSSILDETESKTTIRDRELNVDEINRKKNVNHVSENEKDKWKRMMKYDVPGDDSRGN